MYVYLREAFHPALGFLWGWAMFWTMHSGIIAAIATVFARYTAYFVALDDTDSRIVAVGAVLALSCVNYVGVRQGSNLQTWFTAAKVLAIVVIVIVGLALGSTTESTAAAESPAANSGASAPAGPAGGGGQETSSAVANDPSTAQISLAHFLSALVAGLFAFGGWHMVTYNAEETADPRTTIPRALVLGVAIVTACYLALNTAYFRVLPVETIIVSNRVAADAADAVLGFGGGAFMSALVMFSAFGALAGIILAGPRVYFAMARDRQFAGMDRRRASALPNTASSHRGAGDLGLGSGGNRVLSSALYTRHLHGMDLLRTDGDWLAGASTALERGCAIPHRWRQRDPVALRAFGVRDRPESTAHQSARERHRARLRAARAARLHSHRGTTSRERVSRLQPALHRPYEITPYENRRLS